MPGEPWLFSGALVSCPGTIVFSTLPLHLGGELVRLAEKAATSAMLRTLALVVSHEVRLVASPLSLPRFPLMEPPAYGNDTSWQAMLGNDEREANEAEIAALEAKRGPFRPADGEG
jgi:hypothetical protein